jgi:DinB superfamily
MTTEAARIDDELHRAYDGAAWHGPSFREVLAGVTAEVAARRHPVLAHSIGTLVRHVAAWVEVARRRIVEWQPIDVPPADDFPAAVAGPAAWEATLAGLDRRVRALRELVAGLDPARLDATVPGKDYPVAVMLHGTAQHLAYHAGQIALLRKLLG